jgi:hypothetical protein
MQYSEQIVQEVWEKGRATADEDRSLWRRDACGAWIRRDHYRGVQSEFAWKIENISGGGTEALENLRPFNCANAYDRANGRAHCQLTADLSDVPTPARVLEPRNRKV